MAVDDFLDSEVAVAVAATAALLSPRVRSLARRAAVYSLAELLSVGAALSSAAGSMARDLQPGGGAAGGGLEDIVARPSEAAGAQRATKRKKPRRE